MISCDEPGCRFQCISSYSLSLHIKRTHYGTTTATASNTTTTTTTTTTTANTTTTTTGIIATS